MERSGGAARLARLASEAIKVGAVSLRVSPSLFDAVTMRDRATVRASVPVMKLGLEFGVGVRRDK